MTSHELTHRKGRSPGAGGARVAVPWLRIVIAVLITAALTVCASGVAVTSTASANRVATETLRAVRYGPQPHQLLDLYLPARRVRAGRLPTVIYLHSGGWIAGSRAQVATPALAQLSRGYAVVSVDYQLAHAGGGGSFPAAVYDVKRAIRFLKAGANQWGLDPDRVVLMGTSAGGHLAALSAASVGRLEPDLTGPLADVDSRVVGAVDIVGISDLATFSATQHPWAAPLTADFLGCPLRNGRAECPSSRLRMASVAPYVSAGSPPIFMAYGASDNLVVPATQGAPLFRAWVHAHYGNLRSAVYDVVPGGGHDIADSQIDMTTLDHFLDQAIDGVLRSNPVGIRRR